MTIDPAAIAAEAARRAEEARRRAEEARRRAEAAAKKAAEAAERKAAEAAKKVEAKPKVLREKPSTRFEALKKPVRRESKSTSFQAQRQGPTRRESRSTRFEALKLRKTDEARGPSKAAEARYDELQKESGTKKALEQLGVESARDFQRLGNQYAQQLRGEGEPIYVSKVSDKRDLVHVLQATAATQTGEAAEVMAKRTVATLVAHGQKPKDAAEQAPKLDSLGLTDDQITEMAEKSGPDHIGETAKALATLGDDHASIPDKAAAAIELGKQSGRRLPDGVLEGALGRAFHGLPDAKAAAEALGELTDSGNSTEKRAKAAFDLARQFKKLPGEQLEKITSKLKKLDGSFQALGAAMTLIDGNASLKDKALAAVQLGAALPGVAKGALALRHLFQKNGVEDVEKVIAKGDDFALLKARGVDLTQVKDLPEAKLERLTELAKKVRGEGLGQLVDKIGDEKQLGHVLERLETLPADDATRAANALGSLESKQLGRMIADPKAQERLFEVASKLDADAAKQLGPALKRLDPKGVDAFLEVAQKMKAGTLSDVLGGADDAKRFVSTISRLDPKNVDDFAKAAKELDGGALKLVAKLGATAPASTLNSFIPTLAKVAHTGVVGTALGALGKVLGVMKLDVTADIAGKALKGLGKLLPGISAGVSGIDVAKYGIESAKMQGKQDDLAFLAHTGMKLNALDAALEFIPGVGTLAGVGTGVAALALDLGYSSEKAKYQANPKGYEAPDWVKAVNIGVAVIGPPPGAGIPELVATYGVKDAAELGLWAIGKGGKLATAAWDVLKKIGGPAVEIALKAVDELKDLGEAGTEALEYIAKAPGALGKAVAEKAVDGLKDLGEAGVEALKSIAGSGADVAKKAAEGLKDLADDGIDAAKDALGTLKDIGGDIGDFVGGLVPHIDLPGPL